MTTRIDLSEPVDIGRTDSEGQPDLVRYLELGRLRATHMWRAPCQNLPARETLTIGCRMAGYSHDEAVTIGKSLNTVEMGKLVRVANRELETFNLAADAPRAVNPSERYTLTLQDAIEVAGETIEELELRPLRGGDLWDTPSENPTFGDLFKVGASQAGKPDEVIGLLYPMDAGHLLTVVSLYLKPIREGSEGA